MNNSNFKNIFSSKFSSVLLGLLLVIAAIIIVYFLIGNTADKSLTTTTITAKSTSDTVSATQSSPLSPMSVISPVTPTPPDLTLGTEPRTQLFAEAEKFFNSGNYLKAISLFDQMLEIDPNNQIALTYRGNAFVEIGNYQNAIADYTKAIEIIPDSYPQPYYNRGRAYMFLKEYDKALADLEKSIELDNFDDINFAYRANGNIGLIYHQQGKYHQALEAFDASIAADNTKADVFYLRGETYTVLENYEAAIADYETAITNFPNYGLAYQGLGYAYYKTKMFDKATEALTQSIQISPNIALTHFNLALVYLALDNLTEAKAEVSQAVTLSSNLPEDEQQSIYDRVLTDLETFAKENSDKSGNVEILVNLIPESKSE